MAADLRATIREALGLLGVRRFALGIHDAAFPLLPAEDVGRGTPHADGAEELVALASSLGFDALQLGPQGATSRGNPSPYDGALFSRDSLSIALAPLSRRWPALLRPEEVAEAVASAGATAGRAEHARAFDVVTRWTGVAAARFRALRAAGAAGVAELGRRLDAFQDAHAEWLVRDALHQVLERRHGGAPWSGWPPLDRDLMAPPPGGEAAAARRRAELLAAHADEVADHAFVQLLAHEQHREFRERARRAGLALFGDLQVGLSSRDAWAAQGFLLGGWRMGAPPSRTDPAGQAWGFPVLDPRACRAPDGGDGPALRFVRARARKAFAELDGLRVDHPHGLVCPWVYRDGPDPDAAVGAGARLRESPDLPDCPELAAFAVARSDQLDRSVPRHADGWVTSLDPEQVAAYAVLLDAVVEAAPDPRDVACEILSTQPYPLRRVVDRHGLGRFRVTQKADPTAPRDVYRGENAAPADWIMLGNHDTAPIGTVAARWVARGEGRAQAEYLATRLLAPDEDRAAWVRAVAPDPGALAQARFADLFVGPARQVLVYFTDLVGAAEPYNRPGTVSPGNWSQRLVHGFAAELDGRRRAASALDVPAAVARALRSRGAVFAAAYAGLLAALDAASARSAA